MERIAFEIRKEDHDSLKELAKESGLSLLEFFGNASAMFGWALRELLEGKIVVSIDKKGEIYKEVTMPCFEAIKKS